MYIHEQPDWPHFTWDKHKIAEILGPTKFQQGCLLGKMKNLGFELQEQATLKILTSEVIKTSEIEGEHLDQEQVRSSIQAFIVMTVKVQCTLFLVLMDEKSTLNFMNHSVSKI